MGTQTVADSTLSKAAAGIPVEYTFKWFDFTGAEWIYYIALAIGFFIIFIAYFFGGGKKNKMKISFSIFIGVLLGMLILPLLLKICSTLGAASHFMIAFVLFIDFIFIASVTCNLYELLVIGTHEALFGSK